MRTIRHTRVLPYPAEIVWQALTDRAQIARWLMPNDFEPVVGRSFQFTTDPGPGFDGIVDCTVLAIETERLLKFTWVGGGIDTVVTYTLDAVEGGTRLTVEQTGFRLFNIIPRLILGIGWKRILGRKLPAALAAMMEAE